jgi:putative PIN family toxin of toxin-antitoxin system
LIVIDASSVVGAALKANSIPWEALVRIRGHDRIAMSNDVAAEIRIVLRRPKFARVITEDRINDIEAMLFAEAAWFDPAASVADCRDPNDNKYLELALAANAGFLISSDKDLLALHPWRGIRILTPAQYLVLG